MENVSNVSQETKKGGGAMPTPTTSTHRRNAGGSECKDTKYFTCPQDPKAVEALHQLVQRNHEAAISANMRGCLLTMRTGEEWATEAEEEADDMPLYRSLWYEGQLALLFADTNQGKTILATQIAVDLARQGRRVLYCDFEMSRKQFLKRISRTVDGEEREYYLSKASRGETLPPLIKISKPSKRDGHRAVRERMPLPKTFYRTEPNGLGGDNEKRRTADGVVASDVIRSIEQCAVAADADVIVVDNITYMAQGLEKSAIAHQLVQELKQLQQRRGWSMLILAHTPKRDAAEPLTAKSVAGSHAIIGAVDSAFCIGCSARDSGIKYIKQVKSRDEAYEYGADNVITCEIEKEGGLFLKFKETGYAREADLLRVPTDKQTTADDEKLAALVADGCSTREIAAAMGWSKSAAARRVKAYQSKPDPTVFDVVNLDDVEDDDDM